MSSWPLAAASDALRPFVVLAATYDVVGDETVGPMVFAISYENTSGFAGNVWRTTRTLIDDFSSTIQVS